jgi:hypothetical protein
VATLPSHAVSESSAEEASSTIAGTRLHANTKGEPFCRMHYPINVAMFERLRRDWELRQQAAAEKRRVEVEEQSCMPGAMDYLDTTFNVHEAPTGSDYSKAHMTWVTYDDLHKRWNVTACVEQGGTRKMDCDLYVSLRPDGMSIDIRTMRLYSRTRARGPWTKLGDGLYQLTRDRKRAIRVCAQDVITWNLKFGYLEGQAA